MDSSKSPRTQMARPKGRPTTKRLNMEKNLIGLGDMIHIRKKNGKDRVQLPIGWG